MPNLLKLPFRRSFLPPRVLSALCPGLFTISVLCLSLWLPPPARAAAEGGVVSDFSGAVAAVRERIERKDQYGQRSRSGAVAGAERIRRTVPLVSRTYQSLEACLTDEDLLRAASGGYLRDQTDWCRDNFDSLLDQRGCRDVAVIYLEALGQGFCPRDYQAKTASGPQAPFFVEPPSQTATDAPPAARPITGDAQPDGSGQIFDTPRPGRLPDNKARKSGANAAATARTGGVGTSPTRTAPPGSALKTEAAQPQNHAAPVPAAIPADRAAGQPPAQAGLAGLTKPAGQNSAGNNQPASPASMLQGATAEQAPDQASLSESGWPDQTRPLSEPEEAPGQPVTLQIIMPGRDSGGNAATPEPPGSPDSPVSPVSLGTPASPDRENHAWRTGTAIPAVQPGAADIAEMTGTTGAADKSGPAISGKPADVPAAGDSTPGASASTGAAGMNSATPKPADALKPAGTGGAGAVSSATDVSQKTPVPPPIGRLGAPVISVAPHEEPYMGDQDLTASIGFDPAEVLGLRNENRSAESRFSGVIPHLARPAEQEDSTAASAAARDLPAFTVNRGPAGQMAD